MCSRLDSAYSEAYLSIFSFLVDSCTTGRSIDFESGSGKLRMSYYDNAMYMC